MANKKTITDDITHVTNYRPRFLQRENPSPVSFTTHREVIHRPANCIGRLLAAQQTDGVDGTINNLFKGQYDESFGVVDPATDIRQDPHLLQDALIKRSSASNQ